MLIFYLWLPHMYNSAASSKAEAKVTIYFCYRYTIGVAFAVNKIKDKLLPIACMPGVQTDSW